MLVLRTATRLVGRRQPLLIASRSASSSTADHHQTEDDFAYPKEGFGAPIWRKTAGFAILGVLFYEYLGTPGDNDVAWLPAAGTEEFADEAALIRATRETALLQERQLVRSATRPPLYRSRNPEQFNHVSPYKNMVGMSVKFQAQTTAFRPRSGSLLLNRPTSAIEIATPALLVTTSRGVVPHLTQAHASTLPCLQVPFETFLEHSPPVPTLHPGSHPLHSFLGFNPENQLLILTLRDPHDVRETPANTNNYVSAVTGRGIRRILSLRCQIYHSLLPPFSQKRVERSVSRSASWVSQILGPNRNVLVHMAGGVSIAARKAFSSNLIEKLHGREAEAISPHKSLDDGLVGYVFDLAPLRMEMDAVSTGDAPDLTTLLRASLDSMPSSKLRVINSVSSPHEILRLIRDVGVDIFDSKWAQDNAAFGVALDFVFPAPAFQTRQNLGHNLYRTDFAQDFSSLSSSYSPCPCPACRPVATSQSAIISHSTMDQFRTDGTPQPASRAYIHHLCLTHEMSAHSLLVLHNLAVMQAFLASVRTLLEHSDNFGRLVDDFHNAYHEGHEQISEARTMWKEVDLARGKGRLAREQDQGDI
ncbi:tRNA-guanine transglycosylase [Mycena indigotica]|uniref:tRNA-guanine transglycosylase n=1 Tax=Mycena indigotica TaxID=2126181 RepID=A0A8H6TEM4_9AGAR|nr:tRNA-guanine transglycosylase [Mycena indigotica]KAF7315297.1 tRNA-guanine transglycosylase [Mycena indigotica]